MTTIRFITHHVAEQDVKVVYDEEAKTLNVEPGPLRWSAENPWTSEGEVFHDDAGWLRQPGVESVIINEVLADLGRYPHTAPGAAWEVVLGNVDRCGFREMFTEWRKARVEICDAEANGEDPGDRLYHSDDEARDLLEAIAHEMGWMP